jgi:hypothetical protein
MANIFLNGARRDVETAIMLENATVTDIGKAVAYTDGTKVFVNTDDNLDKILPNYNHDFLKWLLWHERYHLELRHHNRFYKYLDELNKEEVLDKFHVTKDEVNIIMDILVHDSLAKLFPDLVPIAVENLAQMRNRNSLGYTFTTYTLEEMLDEYKAYKSGDKTEDTDGEGEPSEGEGEGEGMGDTKSKEEGKTEPKEDSDSKGKAKEKCHESGGDAEPSGSTPSKDTSEPEETHGTAPSKLEDEHDKTDWSKLEEIDSKEFITESEGREITRQVERLKRKKIRLGKITESLNGLVTTSRRRTYARPSPIGVGGGVILKGSTPARAKLYLCFDASGSMGCELETFKDIISKSIPQAMDTPCEWFTGHYGKGTFKDIMKVYATSGFNDDGDRTIDLCWKAEQQGYSPIGVTDGGGGIYWSEDKIKQLKRTILVGQNRRWLEKVKAINPSIQILDIEDGDSY